MIFKRNWSRTSPVHSCVLLGLVALAGCNAQTGGTAGRGSGVVESDGQIPGDEQERPTPGGTAGAFSALLSSTKTVLIRDDENEGIAMLTAVSSAEATFEWSILPQLALENNLVDMGEPTTQTLVDAGGDTIGSRSTLEIRVLGTADPGSRGTEITVQVVATLEGSDETSTSSARLRIVRPETSLSMNASANQTRIRPGDTVDLLAEIIGGEPFAAREDDIACAGPVTIDSDEPKGTATFTTSEFTGEGDAEPGPGYRVTWTFNEIGLGADNAFDSGSLSINCLASDDDAVVSRASYTAPNATGPVVITVQAQDAAGSRFTTTIPIIVQSLSELQIAQAVASQTSVAPGASIELTAKVAGGEPPYTVEFDTVGGDDNTGIPGATLVHVSGGSALTREAFAGCQQMQSGDETCVVRYNAPDDQEGAELIDVTVTDGLGNSVVNRIAFFVTAETELQLVAIADRARVLPGDTARIDTVFNGGTPPYTVTFEYFNDGTAVSNVPLAPASSFEFDSSPNEGCAGPEAVNLAGTETVSEIDDTNSLSVNYTAPSKVTVERVQITVCDNVGDQVTDSVAFSVSPDQSLVVSASPTPSQVEPGTADLVMINVTAIGGTPPYTVTSASLEAGGPGGSVGFNSTPFGEGGQSIVTFDPPNAVGVAVVRVDVSDSAGQSGTDFADITVIPNQALSASLTIGAPSIDLNDCTTITASAVGGSGNYTFDFSIDVNPGPRGCLFDDDTCPGVCTPGADVMLHKVLGAGVDTITIGYVAPNTTTSNVIRLKVTDLTSSVTVTQGVIIGASGQLAVVAFANPSTVLTNAADAPGGCTPTDAPRGPVDLTAVVDGTPLMNNNGQVWSHNSIPPGSPGEFFDETPNFPTPASTGWCPGADAGDYVLQLRVENDAAQVATALVQVAVEEPLPIVASPGATVSAGQQVNLTQPMTDNPSAFTYAWSFDAGSAAMPAFQPNALSQSVSFTPPVMGSYFVRCTVTDAAGRDIAETITITVNGALAASPRVLVDGTEVVDGKCVVARPGVGPFDGTIDAAHAVANLQAQVDGGVPPFTFSWSATLGGAANYVNATLENPVWNIPTIAGDVDNHAWTVTVTDATGRVAMGSIVRPVKQPVRITSMFPNPAMGTVGNQLSLTFLAAVGSGTDPITVLDIVQTAGAGNCNFSVAFPAGFTNPFPVGVTCDAADTYDFDIELSDDCSDAVISVPFTITIN